MPAPKVILARKLGLWFVMFKTVRQSKAPQQIIYQIRASILEGKLKPGGQSRRRDTTYERIRREQIDFKGSFEGLGIFWLNRNSKLNPTGESVGPYCAEIQNGQPRNAQRYFERRGRIG